MKNNALMVLALAASALMTSAQEPRVTHTQFHSGPVSLGLSATVDRFRHSNGPLWLGYAVPALPRTHHSSCSFGTGSSGVEAGCCNELQLEDTADNLNTSASPAPSVDVVFRDVLFRLDHGEVTKTRVVPVGCTLDAGGVPFEWLTDVQPEDSAALLGKLAQNAAALRDSGAGHGGAVDENLAALSMHATPRATEVLRLARLLRKQRLPAREGGILVGRAARARRIAGLASTCAQRARRQAPREAHL